MTKLVPYERDSDLESAIASIPCVKGYYTFYDNRGKKLPSNKTKRYFLPIIPRDDNIHGVFRINGALVEARIGLEMRTFDSDYSYYDFGPQVTLEKINSPDDRTLYLPLERTARYLWLSDTEDVQPLLGLEGSNGVLPFMLVAKCSMGLSIFGVCEGSDRDYQIISDIAEKSMMRKKFEREFFNAYLKSQNSTDAVLLDVKPVTKKHNKKQKKTELNENDDADSGIERFKTLDL